MRILYIEDSTDNHFLIGFYLKGLPAELDCVETTDLALVKLESEVFDLILLDWNLPGSLSSLDLLNLIRTSDKQKETKVWVISAMQNHEVVPLIKGIPLTTYFRKPIRKAEFLDFLKSEFSELV